MKDVVLVLVLIVVNKVDLFIVLLGILVKVNFEVELIRICVFKSKGFLDFGVGMDDIGLEE